MVYIVVIFATAINCVMFLLPPNFILYLALSFSFDAAFGIQGLFVTLTPLQLFEKHRLPDILGHNMFWSGIGLLLSPVTAGKILFS